MKSAWLSFKSFVGQLFQSKAFGFLAILLVLGTVLLFLGKLAGREWLQLVQWLGGIGGARSMIGDFSTQKAEVEKKKDEIEKNVSSDSDAELASRAVEGSK